MSPTELEQYLRAHIPLARAMDISVVSAGEEAIVLAAPLAPNINPHGTVFGGSGAALGVLAAWSLLHVRLQRAGIASRLVVRRSTIDYEAPLPGDVRIRATLEQPEQWLLFLETLQRKGRARISAVSQLEHAGVVGARFIGEFVAVIEAADQ